MPKDELEVDWGEPTGGYTGPVDWGQSPRTELERQTGFGRGVRIGGAGIPQPDAELGGAPIRDTLLTFGSGAANMVGSLAGGIPQMVGRSLDDPEVEGDFGEGFGQGLSKLGEGIRNVTGDGSAWLVGKMSEKGQEGLARKWLTGGKDETEFGDTAWASPSAIWLKAVSSLPNMIAAMVPGGMVLRATGSVAKAAAVGGAMEGALIGGSVANDISNTVDAYAQTGALDKIPAYHELLAEGVAHEDMVNAIKAAVLPKHSAGAGAFGMVFGSLGMGRLLRTLPEGGEKKMLDLAKSFLVEGVTESIQGGGENVAFQTAIKDNVDIRELANAMIEEGVLGGIMGGTVEAYRMSGEHAALKAKQGDEEQAHKDNKLFDEEAHQKRMAAIPQGTQYELFDDMPEQQGPRLPPSDSLAGDGKSSPLFAPQLDQGTLPPDSQTELDFGEGHALASDVNPGESGAGASMPGSRYRGSEVENDEAAKLVPERPKDIAAQVEDLVDKKTPRKAVYISGTTLGRGMDENGVGDLERHLDKKFDLEGEGYETGLEPEVQFDEAGNPVASADLSGNRKDRVEKTLSAIKRKHKDTDFYVVEDDSGGLMVFKSLSEAKKYSPKGFPKRGAAKKGELSATAEGAAFTAAAGTSAPLPRSETVVPYSEDQIADTLGYDISKSKIDPNSANKVLRLVRDDAVLYEELVPPENVESVRKKLEAMIPPPDKDGPITVVEEMSPEGVELERQHDEQRDYYKRNKTKKVRAAMDKADRKKRAAERKSPGIEIGQRLKVNVKGKKKRVHKRGESEYDDQSVEAIDRIVNTKGQMEMDLPVSPEQEAKVWERLGRDNRTLKQKQYAEDLEREADKERELNAAGEDKDLQMKFRAKGMNVMPRKPKPKKGRKPTHKQWNKQARQRAEENVDTQTKAALITQLDDGEPLTRSKVQAVLERVEANKEAAKAKPEKKQSDHLDMIESAVNNLLGQLPFASDESPSVTFKYGNRELHVALPREGLFQYLVNQVMKADPVTDPFYTAPGSDLPPAWLEVFKEAFRKEVGAKALVALGSDVDRTIGVIHARLAVTGLVEPKNKKATTAWKSVSLGWPSPESEIIDTVQDVISGQFDEKLFGGELRVQTAEEFFSPVMKELDKAFEGSQTNAERRQRKAAIRNADNQERSDDTRSTDREGWVQPESRTRRTDPLERVREAVDLDEGLTVHAPVREKFSTEKASKAAAKTFQGYVDNGGGLTFDPNNERDMEQARGVAAIVDKLMEPQKPGYPNTMLLADGTGFGKTVQTLISLDQIRQQTNQPVLFIVTGQKAIRDTFHKNMELLGIDPASIEVGTYDQIRKGIFRDSDYAAIAFDEAQLLSNSTAKVTEEAMGIVTPRRLYVSATPVNSVWGMTAMAGVLGVPHAKAVFDRIGIRVKSSGARSSNHEWSLAWDNHSWKGVIEIINDMFAKAAKEGNIISRHNARNLEVKPKEVKSYSDIKITTTNPSGEKLVGTPLELERKFAQEVAEGELSSSNKDKMGVVSAALAEVAKVDAVYAEITDALSKGLRPIVSVKYSGRYKQKADGPIQAPGGYMLQVPRAVDILTDRLEAKGISTAHLLGDTENDYLWTGRDKGPRTKAPETLAKVLFITPEKGGAGYDFDHVKGDRGAGRRKLIIATRPGSAARMDQLLGRVERRNSETTPLVTILKTDKFYATRGAEADSQTSAMLHYAVTGTPTRGAANNYDNSKSQSTDYERHIQVKEGEGGLTKITLRHLDKQTAALKKLRSVLERRPHVLLVDSYVMSTEDYQSIEFSLGMMLDEVLYKESRDHDLRDAYRAKQKEFADAKENLRAEAEAARAAVQAALDEVDKGLPSHERPKQRNSGEAQVEGLKEAGDAIRVTPSVSIGSALDMIIKNTKFLHPYRPVLKALKRVLGPDLNVPVKFAMMVKGSMGRINYDNHGNPISITVAPDLDSATLVETLVHEMIHAATVRNINTNPALKAQLTKLLNYAQSQHPSGANGYRDVYEFVAEAYSNREFRRTLKDTKVPGSMRRGGRIRTMWDAFVNAIRSFMGLQVSETNALNALLSMEPDLIKTPPRDGPPTYSMERPELRVIADTLNDKWKDFKGSDAASVKLRPKLLGSMTMQQIQKSYGHLFDRPDGNPVKKWFELVYRKEQKVRKLMTGRYQHYRKWSEMAKKDRTQTEEMNSLMTDTTVAKMFPNLSFFHEKNEHLRFKGPVRADGTRQAHSATTVKENQKRHKELQARYKALDTEWQEMYVETQRQYAQDWDDTVRKLVSNIIERFDFVIYDNNAMPISTADPDRLARRLMTEPGLVYNIRFNAPGKPVTYDSKGRVEGGSGDKATSSKISSELANVLGKAKIDGPYFPLRRWGKYVVSGWKDHGTRKFGVRDIGKSGLQEVEERAQKQTDKEAKEKNFTPAQRREVYQHYRQRYIRGALRPIISEFKADFNAKEEGGQFDEEVDEATGEITLDYYRKMISFHESVLNGEDSAKAFADSIANDGWTLGESPDKPLLDPNRFYTVRQGNNGYVTTSSSKVLQSAKARLKGGDKDNSRALAVLESAFIEILSDTSIRKAELRRKNIQGASRDQLRNFASHARQYSWYMAGLEYSNKISEAMSDIQAMTRERSGELSAVDMNRMEAVTREITIREQQDAAAEHENAFVSAVQNLGFVWFLGSPSYAILNLTQVPAISMPWMVGKGYSSAEVAGAYKRAFGALHGDMTDRLAQTSFGLGWMRKSNDFRVPMSVFDFIIQDDAGNETLATGIEAGIDNSNLDNRNDIKLMLRELGAKGLIDMTFAADMSSAADANPDSKVNRSREFIMEWTRVMPHLTEVFNRSSTAIAAYELARNKGQDHEQAMAFAELAVEETQFDYTTVNKARFMSPRQNVALALPAMFMQHSQHVYYLMLRNHLKSYKGLVAYGKKFKERKVKPGESEEQYWERMREFEAEYEKVSAEAKEAGKTIALISAAHMALGGVVAGIWEPAKWAMGLALMLTGEDDEPPLKFDQWMRREMASIFGEDMARYATYGITGQGSRIGLHNLISSGYGSGKEGREAVEHQFFDFAAGPMGSIVANFMEGIKDYRDGGSVGDVLVRIAPKGLADMSRAVGLYNQGIVDSRGKEIQPSDHFSPTDLVTQFIGFRPRDYTEVMAARSAINDVKYYYKSSKQRYLERWARAKTPSERATVWKDIQLFNKQFAKPMRITKGTLLRSDVANRRLARQKGSGVTNLDRRQRSLEKYGEPYNI